MLHIVLYGDGCGRAGRLPPAGGKEETRYRYDEGIQISLHKACRMRMPNSGIQIVVPIAANAAARQPGNSPRTHEFVFLRRLRDHEAGKQGSAILASGFVHWKKHDLFRV